MKFSPSAISIFSGLKYVFYFLHVDIYSIYCLYFRVVLLIDLADPIWAFSPNFAGNLYLKEKPRLKTCDS
ncbi:hypothetical protein BROC_00486 [Candidatus Brocadiaceae bacterium]|nr:hypothetical protein BROC_00486 [Candidatus Brocadiaceae bacterium]